MTSSSVFKAVKEGKREFFDKLSKRKIYLCAFDLDDGCGGYAHIYDEDGEDYERIDMVDLSCLEELRS